MGRFTKNIVFNGSDGPGQFYAIGLTDLSDLALIVGGCASLKTRLLAELERRSKRLHSSSSVDSPS